MGPFAGARGKPGFYGVLVDVAKCDGKLSDARKHPRVKTVAPEMPGESSLLVVRRAKQPKSQRMIAERLSSRPGWICKCMWFPITQKFATRKR